MDTETKDPFNANDIASERKILQWRKNVFLFCDEMLDMLPAEPIDDLRGKRISYTDAYGEKRETVLFDTDGRLVYHDLSFYSKDMFKWQSKQEFKDHPNMFTWQQTVELEAYDRESTLLIKTATTRRSVVSQLDRGTVSVRLPLPVSFQYISYGVFTIAKLVQQPTQTHSSKRFFLKSSTGGRNDYQLQCKTNWKSRAIRLK